jgi:AcrR family transcriptional regulator
VNTRRGVDLSKDPADERQRKRIRTHRAIQAAALSAVIEVGFEGATVEEICRRAGISQRSFFNYFATKEDALVDAPAVSQAAIDDFLRGEHGLIDDLVTLVASAADQVASDLELIAMRRKLVRDYPQLVGRKFTGMYEFEELIEGLVRQRLASPSATEDREQAQLLGITAAAALRFGWQIWLDRGDPESSLADDIRTAFARLREL